MTDGGTMDAVWLIVDSLSFSATPFADGGPNTMPNMKSIAEDRGVVFDRAYAPGPFSPSSHVVEFTYLYHLTVKSRIEQHRAEERPLVEMPVERLPAHG